MNYYLCHWPDKSFAVVGANSLAAAVDMLDEIGSPSGVKLEKLPTTDFCWDSTEGYDERNFARRPKYVPQEEISAALVAIIRGDIAS